MKTSTFSIRAVLIVAITALTFTSCVKKDYDEPVTANVDPANLTATHTIRQLQLYANTPTGIIDSNIVVSGIITADDASGNFYKTIVLQDSTGGMDLQVDVNNFNTDFPMGRRIFIKCKGMFFANDGNLSLGVQGANNEVGRIPSALIGQYVVKGKWGLSVTPKVIHIDDNNIPTNTLVEIQNVEFRFPGQLYGVGSPPIQEIEDCANNRLDLYSSTFASFAQQKTPVGNGTIRGIYTVYNGSGELQIRGLEDVDMNNLRCDGSNGELLLMPIDSVRMLFTGSVVSAPTGRKIRGTVTSDYSTGMVVGQNMFIQDSTAAIEVHFYDPHTFPLGSEVEVILSGTEISEYQGVLQIDNAEVAAASVTGGSTPITALTSSISQINSNYDQWESRVVKIDNATIAGAPGIFSGPKIVDDGSGGTITLYTSSFATFANDSLPTGPVSLTGILTEFNGTKEILLRNPSDVQP